MDLGNKSWAREVKILTQVKILMALALLNKDFEAIA
jgi:hypothetical protein